MKPHSHWPFQQKDTFHTFRYRSAWITTCRNITLGCEEISVLLGNGERRAAKSTRGAKALITRHIGYPIHA